MSQDPGMPAGRNTTVDRAVDVLLLFDEAEPVLSASTIASRLGMSRSTTYRYLQSLRSHGLVEEDAVRHGFRLGSRVLELARIARKGLGLSEIALPVMTSLAASVDEAVLLTRRSGSQVVCVERVESTHPIRLSYDRGQVLPVHAGASAKVLLAFSEPHEIDEALDGARLPKLTSKTITDKRELRRQLREIRARGYAISDGEADVGVRGVAAPIIDASGRVAAGLSVAGPAFRLGDDRLSEVISEVTNAARTIGERLSRLSG